MAMMMNVDVVSTLEPDGDGGEISHVSIRLSPLAGTKW